MRVAKKPVKANRSSLKSYLLIVCLAKGLPHFSMPSSNTTFNISMCYALLWWIKNQSYHFLSSFARKTSQHISCCYHRTDWDMLSSPWIFPYSYFKEHESAIGETTEEGSFGNGIPQDEIAREAKSLTSPLMMRLKGRVRGFLKRLLDCWRHSFKTKNILHQTMPIASLVAQNLQTLYCQRYASLQVVVLCNLPLPWYRTITAEKCA